VSTLGSVGGRGRGNASKPEEVVSVIWRFSSVPGSAWDGSEPEALPSFRAQAEPGREGETILAQVIQSDGNPQVQEAAAEMLKDMK